MVSCQWCQSFNPASTSVAVGECYIASKNLVFPVASTFSRSLKYEKVNVWGSIHFFLNVCEIRTYKVFVVFASYSTFWTIWYLTTLRAELRWSKIAKAQQHSLDSKTVYGVFLTYSANVYLGSCWLEDAALARGTSHGRKVASRVREAIYWQKKSSFDMRCAPLSWDVPLWQKRLSSGREGARLARKPFIWKEGHSFGRKNGTLVGQALFWQERCCSASKGVLLAEEVLMSKERCRWSRISEVICNSLCYIINIYIYISNGILPQSFKKKQPAYLSMSLLTHHLCIRLGLFLY